MDMQFMKHVDRFAGYPLCGLIHSVDLIKGTRKKADDGIDIRNSLESPKIGVIKFWGMGSLILAAPMLDDLKKSWPKAEIHLITLRPNKGIVNLLGVADNVHYLDLPEGALFAGTKILGFLNHIKKIGFDVIIDLEYLSRFSAIAAYSSGAPYRVGFHSWDVFRGDIHNVRRAFNPYWHITENFQNLLHALGGEIQPPGPAIIKLTGKEDKEAREIFISSGIKDDEKVIAVNCNASTMALARRWPEGSFISLVNKIVDEGLGRVVLLGAPEESRYVESLHGKLKRPDAVENLAGKSSLGGLVGTLRRAALLITNDSGPLHLADALGTPTVSFFGPETPVIFGPRGEKSIALYRGIDCSPCISIYNAKTVRCMRQKPECLTKITVDEAFSAVIKVLGG